MPSVSLTPDAAPDAPVAVVLPGSGYTIQGPLLYWSIAILKAGGWHVRAVEWVSRDLGLDEAQDVVASEVEMAFASAPSTGFAPSTGERLVLAKSLGTLALPWARANDVPGVWLTPLLTVPVVADAARERATKHDLLVGGTADTFWTPDAIVGTAASVVELPAANHSLEVPGDGARSRALQKAIFERVERHISQLRAGS